METNLKHIVWDPHSCECKLELRKEETVELRNITAPYQPGDGVRLAELYGGRKGWARILIHADGAKMVHRPQFETIISAVNKILWRTTHGIDEIELCPGVRLRANVRSACREHADFQGVLQTQRVSCPQVCSCKWLEIHEGEQKELGRFGHRVEELCFEHAEFQLAELPGVVQAAAKSLPPPVKSGLSVEFEDGNAVLMYSNERGEKYAVTMLPLLQVA